MRLIVCTIGPRKGNGVILLFRGPKTATIVVVRMALSKDQTPPPPPRQRILQQRTIHTIIKRVWDTIVTSTNGWKRFGYPNCDKPCKIAVKTSTRIWSGFMNHDNQGPRRHEPKTPTYFSLQTYFVSRRLPVHNARGSWQ